MESSKYWRHLFRDIFILIGSVILAILLSKGDVIHNFLSLTGSTVISSIVAGAFFTSIFTIAPAAIGLIDLSSATSPLFVAFWGAFGAVLVDLVITSFIRKDISKDLSGLSRITLRTHFLRAFHFGFLKWVALVAGVFFIAAPLPDEFGLFLLGISKVNRWVLPFVLYMGNFIGILILISIFQSL